MKRKKVVPRAVQAQQQAPKLNPFELKGSKKKFEILGKRDKSDKKNVIRSREEAVNKRKKTLLVEYKQLRKANTFIDRRFGEDDPQLDEEDKALARFQVHRIKEAKKATKFALSGGDGGGGDAAAGGGRGSSSRGRGDGGGGGDGVHTLTHGGISLEELEELNSRPAEALADLDDDMLEDLVASYHFGGGGRDAGEGRQQQERGGGRPKSKKEIMEEIIAKSKAAKAEKAAQREADEAQLSALDTTFKALVADRGAGLAALVKPPGFDKGRKVKADTDADADYDRAATELAFEAKGQAADATLTKEELEEREAARLAALEAARLKRMRADAAAAGEEGGGDGGDAYEDGGGEEQQQALPQGGYAAKRARARLEAEREERRQRRKLEASGDALDENYDLSGSSDDGGDGGDGSNDDEGVAAANALEARRQAAAAGDHPLQQAFREAAARLAAKHGVEVPQQQEGSDSDSGSEEGDGEGEEGDTEGDGSEEEGVSGEEDEQAAANDDTGSGSGSEDGEGDGSSGSGSEEEQEEEAPVHPTKARKQQQQAAAAASNKQPSAAAAAAAKGAGSAAELEGPLDLSFTPAVPETYDAFVALVGGRPADQLALAIQRIRTFNAAALATDSKRKLQVFYGILVQHFAMLAGQQPLPTAHLDVLTQVLLQLTPEVPFYAATVARTRLDRLHSRLSAALTNPLEASGADGPLLLGWPGPRQLLQLRLFALLFPTSDRRHPVTTPLSLLMGKYLMQCPVASGYQAAMGLLLAGLELHNAAAAARFCPEAVNFVVATLRAFLPACGAGKSSSSGKNKGAAAAAAATGSSSLQSVSRFTPGLLELDCCKAAAAAAGGAGAQHGSKKRSKKQQQQQQSDDQQQQQLPRIQLYPLLSSPPDAPQFSSDAFKLQLLGCAVSTAQRLLQLSHGCSNAEPEVLQPLAAAAEAVAGLRGLPPAAVGAVRGLVDALNSRIGEVVDTRVPMVQSHRVKVVLPREYNPRFEMDFNSAADYDPDRQRSEAKKLQRQLVKEKRGAMRELRRDASFMAAERDAEKARVDAERLASERSFYSELQRQEADAKSGGQRGMNPHKKKK